MKGLTHILGRIFAIEGLEDDSHRTVVRIGLGLALGAVVLRLFFWWYTGRLWEDALITVLHSENFASGLGLTHFRAGEPPLHGFTSPLSVLVPLMGDMVRAGWGLPFIKLVSALCGGLTVLYALGLAIHPKVKMPGPLAVAAMGYLALEHHQVLYGMAGMETQMVTLILLMSLYYAVAWKAVPLGVSLGLCMLARPDFAFWTVIVGAYVLVREPRKIVPVAGTALLLYAPWIIFTTLYYGSPVPNTIVAKSLGYPLWTKTPGLTASDAAQHILTRIGGGYRFQSLFQPLGPSFAGHGTHFRAVFQDWGLICKAMTLLAVLGAGAAVYRRQAAYLLAAGFALVYTVYYVFLVANVFGWYLVPFIAVVLLLSMRGLEALSGALRAKQRLRNAVLGVVAAAYLGCFVAILPKTIHTEKQIQEVIENQVRKKVGLYLGEVMGPEETVGCEPLGYIAYYSRRTVYDWPGLASRKVVAYSKSHPNGRTLIQMLNHLKPDYIVLRARSYDYYRGRGHLWLGTAYERVASFGVSYEDAKDIFLIERNLDLYFYVLKRKQG